MKPETLAISEVVNLRHEEAHAFDFLGMVRSQQRDRLLRELIKYLPDGQRSVICIRTSETPEYDAPGYFGPGRRVRIRTWVEVTPLQYQQVVVPKFDRELLMRPVHFPASIREFIRYRAAAMRAKLGGFVGRLEQHVERQKDDFRL